MTANTLRTGESRAARSTHPDTTKLLLTANSSPNADPWRTIVMILAIMSFNDRCERRSILLACISPACHGAHRPPAGPRRSHSGA